VSWKVGGGRSRGTKQSIKKRLSAWHLLFARSGFKMGLDMVSQGERDLRSALGERAQRFPPSLRTEAEGGGIRAD